MIKTVDWQANDAQQQFVASLHETGFVVLKRHPLSSTLLQSIYDGWLSFFLSDEKYAYQPDEPSDRQPGYTPPEAAETAVGHEQRDLKEYFSYALGDPLPESVRQATLDYWQQALDLGHQLLGWFESALPVGAKTEFGDDLAGLLSPEASLLRILHYPPLSGAEAPGAIRAGAHEDINLITVLPVSNQAGLQVQLNDGRWLDVASHPGDVIVNCGDMLSELTGHYLPSTTHRVVNPAGAATRESRISCPLFLTPDLSARLSDRYTAGSYLAERLAEITG